MSADEQDPFDVYKVVINHEEQYSIWPQERDNPRGWRDAGKSGSKQECLDHIEQVWTDMRPLSLRKHMDETSMRSQTETKESISDAAPPAPHSSSIVERLCEGDHAVEIRLRPENTARAVKDRIDSGYIHVRFSETKGGTELGLQLDTASSDWGGGNFDAGSGLIRLVGHLTLDYVKVRCIANIDLATLAGTGRLERI